MGAGWRLTRARQLATGPNCYGRRLGGLDKIRRRVPLAVRVAAGGLEWPAAGAAGRIWGDGAVQTIKTAIVVVLLLVVLYGAYDVLTRPAPEPPPEVAEILEQEDLLEIPDVQTDSPVVVRPDAASTAGPSPASELATGEASRPAGAPSAAPLPVAPPVAANANAGSRGEASSSAASPTHVPSVPPPPDGGPAGEKPERAPGKPDGKSLGIQKNPFVRPSSNGEGKKEGDRTDPAGQPRPAAPVSQGVTPAPEPDSPAPPVPSPPAKTAGARAFQRVRNAAEADIRAGKLHEALKKLSVFYRSPDLEPAEHQALLDLLDPLAARVIYAKTYHFIDPYITRRHDTLLEIAKKHRVPWQLLQRINGVTDPQVLLPGTQLKVVPGPFRAEIDLGQKELTLFLGGLYAGRFPVTTGTNPAPRPGTYVIRDKQRARTYFGPDNRTIPAGSPRNPYGNVWIDLGQEMCLHGSPSQPAPSVSGCIALSPQDADDLYSILSIGSEVKIRP
ncbi:MAG TPA: LysM peptidoglycan-binding domain-containing protein [Bryobacterales bacterium]|nr:LysM peptidoglycan-binding domain-containing protein [Bryobacterales bacterium]